MYQELLKRFAALSGGICLGLLGLTTALPAWSDDTELYSATYSAGTTGNPKVLIIVDNSGSMDEVIVGEKPPYDPSGSYVQSVSPNRIYWSQGNNSNPPSKNSNQWFEESKNRCGESYAPLNDYGNFVSAAARWQSANGSWQTVTIPGQCISWFWWWCTGYAPDTYETQWQGTPAAWVGLSTSVHAPVHVDCSADVSAFNGTGNPDNGTQTDGFPRKAPTDDASDGDAYTASRAGSNVAWPGTYRFFTSHYMDWYYDNTIIPEDKDYLEITQETIAGIVNANGAVDFGLATFNYNYNGYSGGRIVQRIIPGMTLTDRSDLIDVLNDFDHDGNTPLCETMYEAYLYMTGARLKYGDGRKNTGSPRDYPDRDRKAEKPEGSKVYESPLGECSNTYVILMTDGLPTSDGDANNDVLDVTGEARCWRDPDDSDNRSCLPNISRYMANNDLDGDASNGAQNVLTATIGFNVSRDADNLLKATATAIKPNTENEPAYYFAESAGDLREAFQQILLGIMSTETTFTSPAVAVNSFTRTASLDDVFFAMFEPKTRSDWYGNIKKVKVAYMDVEGEEHKVAELRDAANVKALDVTGQLAASARTYWSATSDGPTVAAGGVGALLVANPLTDRKLYAATGTDGALELLTADNVDAEAFGLPSGDPALYTMWQVTGQTDLVKTLKWAWGYDVDDDDGDGNVNETRSWILPDILHSKPLVVNYGALGSFDKTNPDLRIITGTNGGFVHMFSNATGRELWAYLPLDLAPVISKRRKNSTFGRNVYGVDAPVTVYTIDNNYDGTINAAANVAEDDNNEDKAYLYFGLRRGGKSLHALDISDPDDPKFMWAVNNGSTGLSELGQTWSVPKVARIPGYKDGDGNHKLVLILGAGFDTGKDATGVVTPDSEGRGVFILDALTGALVWSVTPAANSATNLQETGLVHSVAADVTPLDSSGDGLIDRIYFPDTGGNVWRIDLPGDELPDDQQTKWHLVKMFSANGGTPATDRRFFNAIDMVRARENGTPVDILLLGSGDRTNPAHTGDPNDVNDPAVDNQFYMIRDMQTIPYKAKFDVARCTEEGYVDFRCAMPLSPVALYNATAQPFDGSGDTDEQAAYTALAAKFGWYLDLEHGAEKSLSASTTLGGKVYFTTFSPEVDDNDEYQCGFSAGKARLEVVSLINGDRDDTLSAVLGGLIPDTVSLHFGSDGRIRTLTPPADGGGSGGGGGGGGGGPCNPCDVDITTPIPYGNFWNSEDYQ